MKLLDRLWRILTPSQALDEAGPIEKMFFERVYRLAFITGLSYSDDDMFYKLYSGIYLGMAALVVMLEVWHACTDNLSLDEMISVINVIVIHFNTCWKLVIMLNNKKSYKEFAKALESPYFDTATRNRKELVDRWANTHERYLTTLLSISSITLFLWYTFPLIDDVEYNLMIEVRAPFFYQTTLRYIIAYFVIGTMFMAASCLVVMSEVLMQAYLLPLICQYAVLADCFENVFDECAESFKDIDRNELINDTRFIDKCKKRLGNLVYQHLMVLNHTMNLKAILSGPMLGQLCSSSMLICFVGFQATTTITENPGKFMMSLGYLSYNMFVLYLTCRWCEEITSKSQRIGEAIYCSGWECGMYKAPGIKATVMIVIARANKPLVFVAGGMYTLSLSSYTNLVKASYSALNLLLQMSND